MFFKLSQKKLIIILGVLFVILFVGCGDKTDESSQANQPFTARTGSAVKSNLDDTEENVIGPATDIEQNKDYVIENLDMKQMTITLYEPGSNKTMIYPYSLATDFTDKYGDNTSVVNFVLGTVVNVGDRFQGSGALKSISMSNDVWVEKDVSRFSIDTSKQLLRVGSTDYRLSLKTKIFSDEGEISIDQITGTDILTVIGKDKNVYSVRVSNGHGYIAFTNTTLFDGSIASIGKDIATKIYGNTMLEVPEGTYDITVANGGYGGTKSYDVARDEITVVDLNELKGEGPKTCALYFIVTAPNTKIYIDTIPVPDYVANVTYGKHHLVVVAEGYETWDKTLVCNTPSATITLDMSADSGVNTGNSNNNATNNSNTNNSNNNSNNNNVNNSNSNNSNNTVSNSSANNNSSSAHNSGTSYNNGKLSNTSSDYEAEHLKTMSDIITSLLSGN